MQSETSELTLADICPRLELDDPAGFLHAIVHILSGVYRTNSDRHDESVGDDMMTFAQLVYRNSWAQLEQALASFDARVSTSRPDGSLTIHTPGRDLKVYRGGADESFDIQNYDPQTGSMTKWQIAADNAHQLSLFEQQSQDDTTADTDIRLSPDVWFVVHSGNPERGLLRVWIGAPLTSASCNGSSWSFVLALPDLCAERGCGDYDGDSGISIAPSPDRPVGPSYDQTAEPGVRINLRANHDS